MAAGTTSGTTDSEVTTSGTVVIIGTISGTTVAELLVPRLVPLHLCSLQISALIVSFL